MGRHLRSVRDPVKLTQLKNLVNRKCFACVTSHLIGWDDSHYKYLGYPYVTPMELVKEKSNLEKWPTILYLLDLPLYFGCHYCLDAILSPCGCENSCTIPSLHEFLQPQDDSISCSSADTYNIEWNVPTIQNSWPSFLSWTFPFEKNFNIT